MRQSSQCCILRFSGNIVHVSINLSLPTHLQTSKYNVNLEYLNDTACAGLHFHCWHDKIFYSLGYQKATNSIATTEDWQLRRCFDTFIRFKLTRLFNIIFTQLQKWNRSIFFGWSVSQHTCEACGQPLPTRKTPWCSDKLKHYLLLIKTLTITIKHIFNYCAYIRIHEISEEFSRMVPGVVLVSSAAPSDRTVISGELGITEQQFLGTQNWNQ